ncbi:MAG: DUF721 domain-containing protein [Prevotella sp.]|nr:DUF721 domain-containing protein [Prevotella sp.]
MFKKQVKRIDSVLQTYLRSEGLETPLNQLRLMEAWDGVVGKTVVRYTGEKYIKNQTLFVSISNPSLRQDLSMMRSQLVRRLNDAVGAQVISDVKIV